MVYCFGLNLEKDNMPPDTYLRSPHPIQIVFSNDLSELIDNVQSLDTVQKIVAYCREKEISIFGNYVGYDIAYNKVDWIYTAEIDTIDISALVHCLGYVGCVSISKLGFQEEFPTRVSTLCYAEKLNFTQKDFNIETGLFYDSGLKKLAAITPQPIYILFKIVGVNKLKRAKKAKQSSLVS